MKTVAFIFILFLTLVSCNEETKSDTKDKNNEEVQDINGWDEESRSKFVTDCMTSLSEEVCLCSLEKTMAKYSPKDIEVPSEEAISYIITSMTECSGAPAAINLSEDMSGFWLEEDDAMFMKKCNKSLSEEICICSLDKIKSIYKPSDIDKGNDPKVVEGITNAMKECMGLKTE